MSARITSSRQRNGVSEGMALGLLLCGKDSLPFDKIRLDLAFASAWRVWTYRSQFPQVDTDLKKGLDAVWAMTRADSQKQVWALFWEQEGAEFVIYARQQDWDVNNPDDLAYAAKVIDGDVPIEGWKELAQEFLRYFEQ
ncbi:hypothetical protein [Nocardia niwae]|uniref:hypothetical protein n=1 Tax=Nocardia niwae TaxID=626084 RepID=UPI0033E5B7C0